MNSNNLTSSEHSDGAIAEFGSIEDNNSHRAVEGSNTPLSQRRII